MAGSKWLGENGRQERHFLVPPWLGGEHTPVRLKYAETFQKKYVCRPRCDIPMNQDPSSADGCTCLMVFGHNPRLMIVEMNGEFMNTLLEIQFHVSSHALGEMVLT